MAKKPLALASAQQLWWPWHKWEWYCNAGPVGRGFVAGGMGAAALGALGWGSELLGQEEYGFALLLVLSFCAIGIAAALAITKLTVKVVTLIAIVAITIYGCVLIKSKKGDKPWTSLGQQKARIEATSSPIPDGLTFHEETEKVEIILGSTAFAFFVSDLRHGIDGRRLPAVMNGELPIRVSLTGEKLYVNALVYAGPNQQPVRINQNRFTVPNSLWDINQSKTALEIVDHAQRPVFQLIYERPSQIRVNGIFATAHGYITCSDRENSPTRGIIGKRGHPPLEWILSWFSLEPVFKYPAWKHPGVYAEAPH